MRVVPAAALFLGVATAAIAPYQQQVLGGYEDVEVEAPSDYSTKPSEEVDDTPCAPRPGQTQYSTSIPADIMDGAGRILETADEVVGELLNDVSEAFADVQDAVNDASDDVAAELLDAVPKFSSSSSKPINRRPDSYWDHVVRGADVQGVWVTGKNGQKERDIDGKLETYDLRAKKVDPSLLGIDPDVKQYSGYLDDNENDKHLFYCMFSFLFYLLGKSAC